MTAVTVIHAQVRGASADVNVHSVYFLNKKAKRFAEKLVRGFYDLGFFFSYFPYRTFLTGFKAEVFNILC